MLIVAITVRHVGRYDSKLACPDIDVNNTQSFSYCLKVVKKKDTAETVQKIVSSLAMKWSETLIRMNV